VIMRYRLLQEGTGGRSSPALCVENAAISCIGMIDDRFMGFLTRDR
jgi:hypothetical protein